MVDPAVAVLVALVVAVVYGFLGAVLWRIMRALETIANELGEMARRPVQSQEVVATIPAEAEKGPPQPLPRRAPDLDRIRKELEERRKIAGEEEGE